ncbi:MAG: hypothetical protein ABIA47_04310 [bacterium]
MIRNNFNTNILILAIVMIAVVLLAGNRFDATWVGGEGHETHASAYVDSVEYRRGDVIESGEDWLIVDFCDSKIWMYSDTAIKLVDGREGNLELNLAKGRIVVIGNATVTIAENHFIINGTSAITHYSGEYKIEAAPIDGNLILSRPNEKWDIYTSSIQTSVFPPYENVEIDFDPESSSAAEFYSQALGE